MIDKKVDKTDTMIDIITVLVNDPKKKGKGIRSQVTALVIKRNLRSVIVRLPDKHIVKRKLGRDYVDLEGV